MSYNLLPGISRSSIECISKYIPDEAHVRIGNRYIICAHSREKLLIGDSIPGICNLIGLRWKH